MFELVYTSWIGLALIVIDLAALGTIWTSKRHSMRAKSVWTGIVVVIPLLGALAWVFLGRERRR